MSVDYLLIMECELIVFVQGLGCVRQKMVRRLRFDSFIN